VGKHGAWRRTTYLLAGVGLFGLLVGAAHGLPNTVRRARRPARWRRGRPDISRRAPPCLAPPPSESRLRRWGRQAAGCTLSG